MSRHYLVRRKLGPNATQWGYHGTASVNREIANSQFVFMTIFFALIEMSGTYLSPMAGH